MDHDGARRSTGLSRRSFLGLTSAAVGAWATRGWAAAPETVLRGDDLASLSPFEREHLPLLRMPAATANGAKVPIVVEMDHPMTPDHHVTSVRVVNRRDPVPTKGTFHLTPANGRVYVGFQTRVHEGDSEMSVTAECNRHGRFTTSRPLHVPDHAGG